MPPNEANALHGPRLHRPVVIRGAYANVKQNGVFATDLNCEEAVEDRRIRNQFLGIADSELATSVRF